jgi:hypothetical protein
MQLQTAYRIVELKGGHPHTLFHGVKGRRKLPVNRVIEADRKQVRDGTGPYYESGFNVLLDHQACEQYLERFVAPRELRVVKVLVNENLRVKEHSRSEVYLADRMYLPWPQLEIK